MNSFDDLVIQRVKEKEQQKLDEDYKMSIKNTNDYFNQIYFISNFVCEKIEVYTNKLQTQADFILPFFKEVIIDGNKIILYKLCQASILNANDNYTHYEFYFNSNGDIFYYQECDETNLILYNDKTKNFIRYVDGRLLFYDKQETIPIEKAVYDAVYNNNNTDYLKIYKHIGMISILHKQLKFMKPDTI